MIILAWLGLILFIFFLYKSLESVVKSEDKVMRVSYILTSLIFAFMLMFFINYIF